MITERIIFVSRGITVFPSGFPTKLRTHFPPHQSCHTPHITHPAVFEGPNNFCKQNSVQLTVPSFLLTPEEYLAKSTTALDGDVTTEQRAALPTGTLTHCTRIQIDCILRRAVKNLDKERLLLATPCKQ